MKVKELAEILQGLPQEATIRIDTVSSSSPEDWDDIDREDIHIFSDVYLGKDKEEIVCIDAN